jgi:ABC-type amino acid transport substrate-binding protein
MGAAGEKVLRVGIDDAPPVPMQMGRPESGDFRGYEVDLQTSE